MLFLNSCYSPTHANLEPDFTNTEGRSVDQCFQFYLNISNLLVDFQQTQKQSAFTHHRSTRNSRPVFTFSLSIFKPADSLSLDIDSVRSSLLITGGCSVSLLVVSAVSYSMSCISAGLYKSVIFSLVALAS
mgnify:CR=1 FL=1